MGLRALFSILQIGILFLKCLFSVLKMIKDEVLTIL